MKTNKEDNLEVILDQYDKVLAWVRSLVPYKDAEDVTQDIYLQVTLSDVANRVGMPPDTIKDLTYRLAKKYGIRIGEIELKYR